MARTEGIYLAANSVTEIPDGGAVRLEVFNEGDNHATATPLYTWPVSVQSGRFVIDIPQVTSSQYPDTAQFSIVATLPTGEKVRKLIAGQLGGTILQRKGTVYTGTALTLNVDWTQLSDPDPTITAQMAILIQEFDAEIAISRSTWYQWNSYRGTSSGGYHYWRAADGMSMMYEVSPKSAYVQECVDYALDLIDKAADIAGNATHSPYNYYPQNGYKDWMWGNASDPDGINHYHYDWRCGAVICSAMRLLKKHGTSGITVPANAMTTMYNYVEHDVWDKYSKYVFAANTPPVIDSRNLENAVGSGQVGRICNMALVMNDHHSTPGSNRYFTHFNAKIPALVSEITTNGGYPGFWTDPQGGDDGTYKTDISHDGDVFAMLQLSEQYGHSYITSAFRTAVQNHILYTLYPSSNTSSTWLPDSDGQTPFQWDSAVGNFFGPWTSFLTSTQIDRFITDYINNFSVTGAGEHSGELQNLAYLCLVKSGKAL